MTKKELIHQVLNETNIDLYNFWAKKLLIEYPEYRKKIKDYWVKTGIDLSDINMENILFGDIKIDDDDYDYNSLITIDNQFLFTNANDLESEGFLNWILRKEL